MPCCARCVSARWCVHLLQKTTVKRDILEFSGLPSVDVCHSVAFTVARRIFTGCMLHLVYWTFGRPAHTH